jgi:hypothetical protein
MSAAVADAIRRGRNAEIRRRFRNAMRAKAQANQAGGYSLGAANPMGSLASRFANLAGIHSQTHGGYAMPHADKYPYGPHQEDQLNWHAHAGFTHGQPVGAYASDPYGQRTALPGSLHPHHLLSQGGGYGRPAQRFVNPMKGGYGNAW